MSEEDRARATYEKALTLRDTGNIRDAIRNLSKLNASSFTGMHVMCFELLVELCLAEINNNSSKTIITAMRNVRTRLLGTQHLEEGIQKMVDIVFKHLRRLCAQAHADAQKMLSEIPDGALALVALSGVPMHIRARECYVAPCEQVATGLANELFQSMTIGTSRKIFPIFLRSAEQFMGLCKEYNLKDTSEAAARSITRTLQRAFLDPISTMTLDRHQEAMNEKQDMEMKADRKDFFDSELMGSETVKLLCALLNNLTEMGRWRQAWYVLQCLKRMSDLLFEHDGIKASYVMAHEEMARTFWACANYNLHAHCLAIVAQLMRDSEERERYTLRALTAILCASELEEERNPFAFNTQHHLNPEVAALFDEPNLSRQAMYKRLEAQCDIHLSLDKEVLRFAADVQGGQAVDFNKLHADLTALLHKYSYLAPYDTPLRHVILRCQLKCMATKNNLVDVNQLAMHDGVLSREEYVNTVEPAILADTAVPVEINGKMNTLSFRNATKSNLLQTFAHLANAVYSGLAARTSRALPRATDKTTAQSATTSHSDTTAVTVNDLIEAHNRAQLLHSLQAECLKTVDARRQEKRENDEKAKREHLEMRIRDETERRERAQKDNIARLYARYRERQRQERNKLVIHKLRTKYPGLKIDNAIAEKSSTAFEDDLTHLVAAFKRKGSETDRKDVLRGNLLERALRQLEIPKRRENDARNAEQRRAELADARKNFLAQHQREFERRQKEKEILRVYAEDAAIFEDQMRRRSTVEKASKRDEQQTLLQQEMQRLAGRA